MAALTVFMVGIQSVAFLIPFLIEILSKVSRNQRLEMEGLMPTGTMLIWAQVACLFAVPPSAWFLAWLRNTGDTAAYMGFRGFRWSDLGLGAAGVVAVGFVAEFLITEPNKVMTQIFETAEPQWLLWLAVAVMAPVVEEMVFRGFVFDGMKQGLGGWAAALITTVVWTGIHLQYGLREMTVIFLLGMVLAGIRLRSGSVWLCMLLHALNNGASVVYLIREMGAGAK